jgi:hypothetical protein
MAKNKTYLTEQEEILLSIGLFDKVPGIVGAKVANFGQIISAIIGAINREMA